MQVAKNVNEEAAGKSSQNDVIHLPENNQNRSAEIRLDDCRAYICCGSGHGQWLSADNKRVDHLEDLVVPSRLLQDYRSHE